MRRITVPIDFSDNSLNALHYGLMLANELKANLRIVHVRTNKNEYKYISRESDVLASKNIEEWLDEIIDINKKSYLVKDGVLDYKIREGNVFIEIANQAKYDDATLLVVGTHGASGFEDKWLGSNAYRLVSHSTVPVITVPPTAKWKGIDNIVVPISMSKASRQKVPSVAGLAKVFGAKVHIVGVKFKGNVLMQMRLNAFVKQAAKFIADNAEVKVETHMIENSSRKNALLEYAVGVDADIVVTRIHHGVLSWDKFFKPFSNQIINESTSPVLSIHTKE